MNHNWMIQIENPNRPKRTRKRKKKNECLPDYLPDNMPVAHSTRNGRGKVGRLIRIRR